MNRITQIILVLAFLAWIAEMHRPFDLRGSWLTLRDWWSWRGRKKANYAAWVALRLAAVAVLAR